MKIFCLLQVITGSGQDLVMTIPLSEPLPNQYFVKAISDRWLGCDVMEPLRLTGLILPESHPPHTGAKFVYLLKKKILI